MNNNGFDDIEIIEDTSETEGQIEILDVPLDSNLNTIDTNNKNKKNKKLIILLFIIIIIIVTVLTYVFLNRNNSSNSVNTSTNGILGNKQVINTSLDLSNILLLDNKVFTKDKIYVTYNTLECYYGFRVIDSICNSLNVSKDNLDYNEFEKLNKVLLLSIDYHLYKDIPNIRQVQTFHENLHMTYLKGYL